MVKEGDILWEPSKTFRDNANITAYMQWLKKHKGLEFNHYNDHWHWSVEEL